MTATARPKCPTCGHIVASPKAERKVEKTEAEFCEWVASLMKGKLEFHYGSGRARGKWYDGLGYMNAIEASVKVVRPAIEAMGLDMTEMGFKRHWHNFGNVQGIYRMMSLIGFYLQ